MTYDPTKYEVDYASVFQPHGKDWRFPWRKPDNWTPNEFRNAMLYHMERTGARPWRQGDQQSSNGWTQFQSSVPGQAMTADDLQKQLMMTLMGVK